MKSSLLILTTEAVAEVLHDEHAIHTGNGIHHNELGHTVITMWRGKVGKTEHAAECQRWRDIADKFSTHLADWMRASGVNEVNLDMASPDVRASFDLTAVSAQIAERANRLQAENEELRAKLLDTTAAAALHAERAARLQISLDLTRAHETHLIQERDRLIHHDLSALHKQVQQLSAERDALSSQANHLDQEKDAALRRLQASEDRERRLSERLANIASLTSDM